MSQVSYLLVEVEEEGQRIDNYLIKKIKGLPKGRLYRALRTGEVRVNGSRVKPEYHISAADKIRLPPFQAQASVVHRPPTARTRDLLSESILYEDDQLLVINKPRGMPVHGGSGEIGGLIEHLRQMRPHCRQLALVHRLDKATSGCLLLAKKRGVLLELQKQLVERGVDKRYLAIAWGRLGKKCLVDAPLLRSPDQRGEDKGVRVVVNALGKSALTEFKPLRLGEQITLLEVRLLTGRTHQIRVHAAHIKHPLLGDDRYGIRPLNRWLAKKGYDRLYLHAASLELKLLGKCWHFEAPAPDFLSDFEMLDQQLAFFSSD